MNSSLHKRLSRKPDWITLSNITCNRKFRKLQIFLEMGLGGKQGSYIVWLQEI